MKIQGYKDLEVWKKGLEIVKLIYRLTDKFPKDERYALTSQMQRAGVSVSANIAEGYARQYRKEYIQFLHISLGSCSELETLSLIAKDRKYVADDQIDKLEEMLDHESKMLMKLIKKLKNL